MDVRFCGNSSESGRSANGQKQTITALDNRSQFTIIRGSPVISSP
jgi:hypothetical protein